MENDWQVKLDFEKRLIELKHEKNPSIEGKL